MKKVEIKKGFMFVCDGTNEATIINVDKVTEIFSTGNSIAIGIHDYGVSDRVVMDFTIEEFWELLVKD